MKITRSIPRQKRLASIRGVIMVDTVRGVLRVRAWPKKYGKARSAAQQYWIDWFRQANQLAKYADGMAQARAIEMTRGTGLYPRDVMLSAMRGRLYIWTDETGGTWYPMAAINDISESLDVLAQFPGSVLVRAPDRWRSVVPEDIGDVLTYMGDAAAPVWLTPAAGAGVTQQNLTNAPLVVDDTVSEYDFDAAIYSSVQVTIDDIVFAANDHPLVRFSYDGGVTYKTGGGDYRQNYVAKSSSGQFDGGMIYTTPGNQTNAHRAIIKFDNMKVGQATWQIMGSHNTSDGITRGGLINFDGPVTNIKLLSLNGSNFETGTLRLTGIVAA